MYMSRSIGVATLAAGCPRTDPGVQFCRTGLLALNLRHFRTRQALQQADTDSPSTSLPLFTMLIIRAAHSHRLAYPLVAQLLCSHFAPLSLAHAGGDGRARRATSGPAMKIEE